MGTTSQKSHNEAKGRGSLSKEDLIRLHNEKSYEKILEVKKNANQEVLDRALLRFKRKYKGDSEALSIGYEAYTILSDKEEMKKVILWRWLMDKFSAWDENTREEVVNAVLDHFDTTCHSYSALQKFLRSGEAMDQVLVILGTTPAEAPITKDEQKEGCELLFESVDGEIIRVRIPPKVKDGEIIIGDKTFIKIKVIPKDAHGIFSYLVTKVSDQSGFPPEIVRSIINEKAVVGHIRERLKQGWSDWEIIRDMASHIELPPPAEVPITKDEQREGCELLFGGPEGEIRIRIPPKVKEGEIIMVEAGIIKVKIIPKDAHDIFSQLVKSASHRSDLPPEFIRIVINEKTAVKYIRGRIKQGWSDEKIIKDMISDLGIPKKGKSLEKFLKKLGIPILETPITKDEQREGCKLLFEGPEGEIRIHVPPGVKKGEIIIKKGAVIKIKVIKKDAHDIFSKFVKRASSVLGIPPEVIKHLINEEVALTYFRGGIKQGWSDEKIIDNMIYNLIEQSGLDMASIKGRL